MGLPPFLMLMSCILRQVASTGEKARGPTGEEFLKDVIPEAKKAAEEKGIRHPIFAFDNADIHELARDALPEGQVLQIPTWSPDFMKVIEHNHAYVVDAFEKLLNKKRARKYTAKEFQEFLTVTFFKVSRKEVVQMDLNSIREMLRAIIANDGDYADRPSR